MRSQTEVDELIKNVLNDVCPPCHSTDERYRAERRRRRDLAVRYCIRFSDTMQSDEPYRSRDEAIQKLAPIAVWFLGWAARQFAIFVIKLLWARWHEQLEEKPLTTECSDASSEP